MIRVISNIFMVLFILLSVGIFTPIPLGEIKNPAPALVYTLQQNRTVITCYDTHDMIWGGQGTITQVDETGVWITTAAHVAHDNEHCDVMFRDGSVHTSHTSWESKKSDVAILFASRAYWPTYASMQSVTMGEHVYVFGEAKFHIEHGVEGDIEGVMLDFNDKLYDGHVISRMPSSLMHYPANKENLVLTNLYSRPGSSGGGVFDVHGNLVGLVSGGSMIDEYVTYIVDTEKSAEEEEQPNGQRN